VQPITAAAENAKTHKTHKTHKTDTMRNGDEKPVTKEPCVWIFVWARRKTRCLGQRNAA
jgi:hypothetical protein